MASRALTVERIYQQIELEILVEIGKLIAAGELIDTETNVTHWKGEKLKDLGKLSYHARQIIAKHAGKAIEEVQALIDEAGLAEIDKIDAQMEYDLKALGKEYIPPTSHTWDIIALLRSKAASDLNLVNAKLLTGAEQVYKDILNKGAADFLVGRRSLYDSTVRVLKEWTEQGIPVPAGTVKPFKPSDKPTDGAQAMPEAQAGDKSTTTPKPSGKGTGPSIVDKAGRRIGAEGYVAMTLRATQKNLAVALQEARLDEYGIDLVEISSHLDSRPSHAPFQGRIYSRSGMSSEYPPLSDTGYGKIDGLVTGINCRHQMYPYEPGVSTQRYKPYDKAETTAAYKDAQRQRALERDIRRAKKELEVLKATGADEKALAKARQRIRDRQKRMRDFIEDTGRTRRPQRERVVTAR